MRLGIRVLLPSLRGFWLHVRSAGESLRALLVSLSVLINSPLHQIFLYIFSFVFYRFSKYQVAVLARVIITLTFSNSALQVLHWLTTA